MLFQRIKQLLSGQLVRNAGWMGIAELANRVFRLGTTVTLARVFSIHDYGLMAIVFTSFEIAHVIAVQNGLTEKIVQARKSELSTICNTIYWLSWLACLGVACLQAIAAFGISHYYQEPDLLFPLLAVAVVFLMMPYYTIQYSLVVRENRFKIVAFCNVAQSLGANILTIIFALLGFGVWSVVLPMVFTTPLWIIIFCSQHSWKPPLHLSFTSWQSIVSFSKNILGVELLSKLNANLDYLLVGRFIGLDALGIYYFAFNAGLGLSLNVMDKFTTALFPHLCEVREDQHQFKQRYLSSLKTLSVVFIPLILLQSGLAPFYVPLVFGQKWISAIPIIVLICLSALPRPFWLGAARLLDADDKTHVTLYLNLFFTVIFGLSILTAVQWGILWVAIAVCLSHLIALPLLTLWSSHYVLNVAKTPS